MKKVMNYLIVVSL